MTFLHLLSDQKAAQELEKTYGVKGHPSFVLTNASGEVIDRWVGYRGADNFVTTLAAAVADPTTVEQKTARFEKSPTAKDAATLGRIHAMRGERAEALALYRRAQELDPKGPYAQPIFDQTAALYGKEGSSVTTPDVVKAADAALASAQATPETRVAVAFTMRGVAERAKDMKLMAPYVESAIEATRDMANANAQLLVQDALYVKGDTKLALELKRRSMPIGWMEQPDQLNEFAWWSFENKVNLTEAEALARKGVELSQPGPDRAQILDTVAELASLRGDHADAVKLTEQAIAEDGSEEHYKKQLERFRKLRDGKPGIAQGE